MLMDKAGKANEKKKRSITRVIIDVLVVNTLLNLTAVLVISGLFFYQQASSIYDDLNKSIVGEASSQIDSDLIKDMANTCIGVFKGIDNPKEMFKNDPEGYYAKFAEIARSKKYIEVQDKLKHLCSGTQASEIDIVIFFPNEEMGIYIVDARDVELIKCGEFFDIERKYFDEKSQAFKGFYSNSRFFGKVWTSGIPVYNDEQNDFCVYMTADIPTSVINGRLSSFIVKLALISLVISGGICIAITYALRHEMVRPFKEISDLAASFVDNYEKRSETGKSNVFGEVDAGSITEMNTLLMSMQTMEKEMNGYLNELRTATAEKERISLELELASKIQTAMIPSIFPPFPERKEFSIYATMTPAKEVGGDFYDFYLIDDDHLGVVMADVAGKGIPAALLMMVSKIIIKNYALMHNSPADVLELVNNQLCSNNQADMFVTAWVGILTISEGKFIAASAGHEYPIIKKGSGGFEMMKDKHGFVLGGIEGSKYKNYEFSLGRNDTLFLYTDGLPEATNTEDEMFGPDRIIKHLNMTKNDIPEIILDHMKNAVKGFVGSAQQFDDLTMLALQINEITKDKS